MRPNSHKENQSPWQIIERLAPHSPLELCLLPPVFLDYYINDSGGYDVPRLPYLGGSGRARCGSSQEQQENPVKRVGLHYSALQGLLLIEEELRGI